jgi:2-keto-4-pentenoate hydratase/2-oxohepta-3-ene-1,7-dioic acid hydratase in catechol pathway
MEGLYKTVELGKEESTRQTASTFLKVADMSNSDLIFSVPELISFLSQNTTLLAGTVIITGTPAGVGLSRSPRETLKSGDEFAVEILPYIGTLINKFENA